MVFKFDDVHIKYERNTWRCKYTDVYGRIRRVASASLRILLFYLVIEDVLSDEDVDLITEECM